MVSHSALLQAYLENALKFLKEDHPSAMLIKHTRDLLVSGEHKPSAPSPVHLSYHIGLDPGIKRARMVNEDYVFATHRLEQSSPASFARGAGLFVVADGMGGHVNGAEASRLAVHTVVDAALGQIQADLLPYVLKEGVRQANRVLCRHNAGVQTRRERMGTTMTIAATVGTSLCCANVGDSRAYLLRWGEPLRQVTRDHSMVARMVATGEIVPEEIYTHPKRNQIYRSLGDREQLEVDTFLIELHDRDIVLLCSDGLWEMVPDAACIETALMGQGGPEEAVEHLVELARMGGGHDNIGVVVMQASVRGDHEMPTLIEDASFRKGPSAICSPL